MIGATLPIINAYREPRARPCESVDASRRTHVRHGHRRQMRRNGPKTTDDQAGASGPHTIAFL
jgi:hypothetical protein